ncbi:MAG: HlyD family efflux transporter periplasmic adaptor subunit [Lachnospiraceae bacterium]|jgi:clumping factor B
MRSSRAKKRVIRIIVICLVCVLAAAGIAAAIIVIKGKRTVDVFSVSMMSQGYWGNDSSFSGNAVSGQNQQVRLKEGIVNEVRVQSGDKVKKGDVLMVYDVQSFGLTLQKDEAQIAVTEFEIEKKRREIEKYKSLRPSEEMPVSAEEIIDMGPLVTDEELTDEDFDPDKTEYSCSLKTVIKKSFLRRLRENGGVVDIKIYADQILTGSIKIDGEGIPNEITEYIPREEQSPEPGDPDPEDSDADNSDPESSGPEVPEGGISGDDVPDTGESENEGDPTGTEGTQSVFVKISRDPLDENAPDFEVSKAIGFGEEEIAVVDPNGNEFKWWSFFATVPQEYERYVTVYENESGIPEGEDYVYSRKELAEMVKTAGEELKNLELDLKLQKNNYEQDKIISINGEITALSDGVVSEVKDYRQVPVGEVIIEIRGSDQGQVIINVDEYTIGSLNMRDVMSVSLMESGIMTTGTVEKIGEEPAENYYSNNNSSYYPVTLKLEDTGEESITIGEYCMASLSGEAESQGGLYLPLMYVRDDSRGSYVMKEENGHLTKQYLKCGRNLYGSVIEIKEGLSTEDYIAFPYDAGEREGTPTVHSDEIMY